MNRFLLYLLLVLFANSQTSFNATSIPQDSCVCKIDTTIVNGTIYVASSPTGDDYPTLQAALTYQAIHPGTKIIPQTTDYYCNHGLLCANFNGTDYAQVKLDIEGPVDARNTPISATIHFTNLWDFGLAVQNCKGCTIKNLNLIGAYAFPSSLNAQQIDTLAFSSWPDTINGGSRTSPYAGIVIDPFSDPMYYTIGYKMYPHYVANYVSGMSQGASTAIDIDHCQITNFVVGVMVTPSMQSNGELINVSYCRIDNCKVPYAYSQAQSKANMLIDLMSWGNCQTIVDGVNYGFRRGDGSTSPMVQGMNVAGPNHQLYNLSATSFPISWNNVYAEGLFKLGYVRNCYAGAHFSNFQIDFQGDQANLPQPDYYIGGAGVVWTNCMLRLYNDNSRTRLVLNAPSNTFRDGVIGTLPVVMTYSPVLTPPYFDRVGMYYQAGMVPNKSYDSLVYLGSGPFVIDRTTFTGYIISNNAASCQVDDLLTCWQTFLDEPWDGSLVSPAGFVSRVTGDTVFFHNSGVGIHTGEHRDVFAAKIKSASFP